MPSLQVQCKHQEARTHTAFSYRGEYLDLQETDLGVTETIDFDNDNIIIGLDKKFLRLHEGKQLQFHCMINENGELVLRGPQLLKPRSTGVKLENVT